jgi:hypothetical protein
MITWKNPIYSLFIDLVLIPNICGTFVRDSATCSLTETFQGAPVISKVILGFMICHYTNVAFNDIISIVSSGIFTSSSALTLSGAVPAAFAALNVASGLVMIGITAYTFCDIAHKNGLNSEFFVQRVQDVRRLLSMHEAAPAA